MAKGCTGFSLNMTDMQDFESNQNIFNTSSTADMRFCLIQLHEISMLPHNIQHARLIQLEGVMVHELFDTCKAFMQSVNFKHIGCSVQIMPFEYIYLTFLGEFF